MSDASDPQDQVTSSEGRRRFLTWLVRGFLSLWGLGFAWVITAFVGAPKSPRSLTETVIKVGPIDSIPAGGAKLVQHGKAPIWVIRTQDDALIGLSAVCTHLHCILTWDRDQRLLNCPCHNGSFDLNGNVLSGPPPRALKRHEVETQLGQIYVHL